MSNEKKEKKGETKTTLSMDMLMNPPEILAKIVENLSNKENAKMFSEYNDEEIQKFSVLEAFNVIVRSPLLTSFIENHDLRRISLGRKGRAELVIVSRSMGVPMFEERSGILDKLLRRRRF